MYGKGCYVFLSLFLGWLSLCFSVGCYEGIYSCYWSLWYLWLVGIFSYCRGFGLSSSNVVLGVVVVVFLVVGFGLFLLSDVVGDVIFGDLGDFVVNVVESVWNFVNFYVMILRDVVVWMFFEVGNWMDLFSGGVVELLIFVSSVIGVFLVVWFLFLKLLWKFYFYVELGFIVCLFGWLLYEK